MECREARERLSDYQDGGPGSAAGGSVGAHLRECAGCAEIARSLGAVREGLRRLPPVAAPPELLERVREAVAREGGASAPGHPGTAASASARSLLSRLRIPLEAAAAVLLVASIWWYQRGASPPPAPHAPAAPFGTAAPQPSKAPATPPVAPAKIAPAPPAAGDAKPSRAAAPASQKEVASLPPGTPEPKPRDYSPAGLPTAPAVRASSESARIVPAERVAPAGAGSTEAASGAAPGTRNDTAPAPAPRALAATPSGIPRPLPYGREVVLDVTPEAMGSAGERIAAAARRLGGAVERVERLTPGGDVAAVRVLLPEPAANPFLSELERIGKVPPEGKPTDSETPAGPARDTVVYTVRIRVR